MLNCAVTYRSTDKKPCDNKLNPFSSAKLVGAFDIMGGSDMSKIKDITASLNNSFDNVNSICGKFSEIVPKPALIDESVGRYLPLCRVTGTDHRANSAEVPCGSR